ncbi:hypothetical protein BDV96DRAFT_605487 [Lophiotrema nucula]|uniref:Vacuolar protein sorting-associated protein 62 n=1 Tax=Lophiotrema nucula TaxID=690887 RepID=A0A6A5YP63_9PLEO|nr:hypothetical protein BDV96DRAFT_605487 [Lophiotrema nucula]
MVANDGKNTAIPVGVPQYVIDHAPLLHLSTKDPYKPSSYANTLRNTRPQIHFRDLPSPSPLTLSHLDQLNNASGGDVYLTSTVDITTNPEWLKGIRPDANGSTGEEKTSVVIVVEKGGGVTDVFYVYFWAFNWGGVVLGEQLGDHVGDWEHNMIRFQNGIPKAVWYSQHANGEAFTFSALKKDKTGKRPLAFAANGSHALYPTPGTHDHTIPNLTLPVPVLLVDETDPGPIYDPLLSSYYYSYTASTKTLTPYTSPSASEVPVGFLYFKGRWGDEQYPDTDQRQKQLVGNRKYVGGPTGPLDKQVDRKEVWPQNAWSKGQRVRGWVGLWVYGPGRDFVSKVVGWVGSCGGRKKKGKRVLVSGEGVR